MSKDNINCRQSNNGVPTTAKDASLDYSPYGSGCVTDLSYWNANGRPNRPYGMDGVQWVIDVNDIPSGKLTWTYANTPLFWDAVWTFLFVEMFDSFGTINGIMARAGFTQGESEEVVQKRVNRAMCVDGFGLVLGSIIGSNSITCYIESNTGVEAGARTGLASFWTGAAFFMSLVFVKPFVMVIPDAATCCALVMVGVHSFVMVKDLDMTDFINVMTSFLTIATMGFTYSIANGICASFIWFTYMRTLRWIQLKVCEKGYLSADKYGPPKDVETDLPHPLMFLMASFMCVRFAYLKA